MHAISSESSWLCSSEDEVANSETCDHGVNLLHYHELLVLFDFRANCGFDPLNLLEEQIVHWTCSNGLNHSFCSTFLSMVSDQACRRCRDLSNSINLDDFPRLKEQFDLEANYLVDPSSLGSHETIIWRCQLNASHRWTGTLADRIEYGAGCQFCARRRLPLADSVAGFPPIADEWHPIKNRRVTARDVRTTDRARRYWQCSLCQNTFCQSPLSRFMTKAIGCRVCRRLSGPVNNDAAFSVV